MCTDLDAYSSFSKNDVSVHHYFQTLKHFVIATCTYFWYDINKHLEKCEIKGVGKLG